MKTQYRFIQPLDVVNFRGNKSFGEAGERGESDMPPQPSIFSGALRSYWLAEKNVDLAAFAKNELTLPEPLNTQLGKPNAAGSFRVQKILLAKKGMQGNITDVFMPLPHDAIVLEKSVQYLQPQTLPKGLASSAQTPSHALLKARAEKPKSGCWLNKKGIAAYVKGEVLKESEHLIAASTLWATDERLGIALSNETRTAEEGKLYTTESIALKDDIGFVVAITGAQDYPQKGILRLGGDGKAAAMNAVEVYFPEPDWKKIETQKKFKLMLTTPALFEQGCKLPTIDDSFLVTIGDGTATLACAAVSRFGVISGWDLAKWQPKDAQRVSPAGSVYWLENYTGTLASLQKLQKQGIGVDTIDASRRAEGYNNFMIANWN